LAVRRQCGGLPSVSWPTQLAGNTGNGDVAALPCMRQHAVTGRHNLQLCRILYCRLQGGNKGWPVTAGVAGWGGVMSHAATILRIVGRRHSPHLSAAKLAAARSAEAGRPIRTYGS